MRKLIKKFMPTKVFEVLLELKQIQEWRKRGYLGNSPQFVKQNVFKKYGVPRAQWVETGTYMGTTTNFLSKNYSFVYSIEPALDLYNKAHKRFYGKNVKLFNDVSEFVLPLLLPKLKGDINFWLDGHYSAGITFKGEKDCPIEIELASIIKNINNFSKVTILIDDVRFFIAESENNTDYPSIDYLVNWARNHNFKWNIQNDIFVMRNFHQNIPLLSKTGQS